MQAGRGGAKSQREYVDSPESNADNTEGDRGACLLVKGDLFSSVVARWREDGEREMRQTAVVSNGEKRERFGLTPKVR